MELFAIASLLFLLVAIPAACGLQSIVKGIMVVATGIAVLLLLMFSAGLSSSSGYSGLAAIVGIAGVILGFGTLLVGWLVGSIVSVFAGTHRSKDQAFEAPIPDQP